LKTGICSYFGYGVSVKERARLISEAGFDYVILWWSDDGIHELPKEKQPEVYLNRGLGIRYAHAPFNKINDIWDDGLAGQGLYEALSSCVADCGAFGIPVAVMHISEGDAPPPQNDLGYDRVRRLFEQGEKRGVCIAFENTRRLDYLRELFKRVSSERIKFCYDVGHEYCLDRLTRLAAICDGAGVAIDGKIIREPGYVDSLLERLCMDSDEFWRGGYPGIDLLSEYGDRLAAMHLHDNFGTRDEHLMPFDGKIPWENVAKRLKKIGPGEIILENVATESDKNKYSPEEYLAESMARAQKFMRMVE